MESIRQNIDAYSIVAEILNELRGVVRRELGSAHGRDWPRNGVPTPTLERLIERKEREKAIDWYETEYQELTDFAGFEDLLEILEHDPMLLTEVRKLAPSPALLHARFLELEVMRSKLGLARPISETELSFLGTFHLRFRKAMDAQKNMEAAPVAAAKPAPAEKPEPAPPVVARPEPGPEADEMFEIAEEEAAAAAARVPEPSAPVPEASAPMPEPTRAPALPAPPVKPMRPLTAPSAPRPPQRPVAATAAAAAHPATPAASRAATAPAPAPAPPPERNPLDVALEAHEHRVIFKELYREVMEIAEGLWTTDAPTPPRVWDKVRVSDWYEQNFSKRGLKPLSDFYEVIRLVGEKMREGIARDELQEFLKRSNFAQLLLALRDMFQKNQI